MKISIFGIIWIILLILSLRKSIKYTIFLVLFSFVFQSAWVVLIYNIDINATLISSVFFVVRYLIQEKGKIKIPKWGIFGILYSIFILCISIIAPIIFKGLEVQHMTNNGYNFNIIDRYTIGFSIANLTQPLSVILYVIVAVLIYNCRKKISWVQIEKLMYFSFSFVFVVGIIHIILMLFGIPTTILRELFHNEYYILGDSYFDFYLSGKFARFMSTFYEPSYCGAYLSICLMFFLNSEYKHRKLFLVLCVTALVLNMSSTGFASSIICIMLYLFNLIFIEKKINKKFMRFISIVICFLLLMLLVSPSSRRMFYQFTIGKANTGSFDLRSILNRFAFDVFKKSYGIGVGVNSVETSSIIYALLSQVGIIGSFLYVLFVVKIYSFIKNISNINKKNQIVYMLFGTLVASLLSCSALNFGVFWLTICIMAACDFEGIRS